MISCPQICVGDARLQEAEREGGDRAGGHGHEERVCFCCRGDHGLVCGLDVLCTHVIVDFDLAFVDG